MKSTIIYGNPLKYALLGYAFFLTIIANAQTNLSPSGRLDSLFSRYTSNTPGVAVGIVKNGELIFSKGYGNANLEYNIPITTKTVFNVASVSKQFTAFSTYLLADQGLIHLEDDIRNYIPELPRYQQPITIGQLLAHTSGLRDQWALLLLSGWQMEDVISTGQILKLVTKQQGLNFEPGTRFGYSNTGYTLLAKIVERVSGKSLAQFAKDRIFEPLQMNNTRFLDDFHTVVKNKAHSYELKNGQYVKKNIHTSNVGPSNLLTTVEDLVKWNNNFEKPVVGNEKLLEAFNSISKLKNGEPVVFNTIGIDTLFHAKGQIARKHRGLEMIKHGGHMGGYRSFLARFPKEKMTIITLSNDEHYEIFARGLTITEYYLGDRMTAVVPISQKELKQIPTTVVESSIENLVGNYKSSELDTSYSFEKQKNRLAMKHKRLPDMVLDQIDELKFKGNNYFDFEIQFTTNKTNRIDGFTISNFGVKKLAFRKTNP